MIVDIYGQAFARLRPLRATLGMVNSDPTCHPRFLQCPCSPL